jgi:hypothetical protein
MQAEVDERRGGHLLILRSREAAIECVATTPARRHSGNPMETFDAQRAGKLGLAGREPVAHEIDTNESHFLWTLCNQLCDKSPIAQGLARILADSRLSHFTWLKPTSNKVFNKKLMRNPEGAKRISDCPARRSLP